MKRPGPALLLSLVLLHGCLWGDDDEENLDIPLVKPEAGATEKSAGAAAPPAADEKKARAKPAAKVDWRSLFKRPPGPRDKSALETAIKKWRAESAPASLLKIARGEQAMGRLVAAETAYRETIRQMPDDPVPNLELAQLYLKMNRLDEAFDYIARVRDLIGGAENPARVLRFQYRYTLALGLLGRGEAKEGTAILSDLLEADPTFSPAYQALGTAYLNQDRLKIAEFIGKRGLDRGGKDAALITLLGVIAWRQGKATKAKKLFEKAMAASPTFASPMINRANLSIERGEYEEAELDLQRAISLEPGNVEARISLGILYRKTGKYNASQDVLNQAIRLNPESAHARFNLAILMDTAFRNPDEALRLLYEVLQVRESTRKLRTLARFHIDGLREHKSADPHQLSAEDPED